MGYSVWLLVGQVVHSSLNVLTLRTEVIQSLYLSLSAKAHMDSALPLQRDPLASG